MTTPPINRGVRTWRRSKFTSRPGDAERWVKSRDTQPRPRRKRGPFTARLQLRSGGFTLYGTAAGEVTPGPAPTLVDVRVQDSGTVTGRCCSRV